jgi:hypothetical protein
VHVQDTALIQPAQVAALRERLPLNKKQFGDLATQKLLPRNLRSHTRATALLSLLTLSLSLV